MVQTFIHNRPIDFLLPDFLSQWPYERRLHPDYGTVDVESALWVTEHQFFSAKAQKSFDASFFGLLGCLIFPLATKDFCRSGCDLANVYFVIDEFNDVAEPQAAAQVCDVVMDVLRNPFKERKPGDKLGVFMQEFWQRALTLTNPGAACVKQFIDGFDLYMTSMIQEAEDRESKRVRPIDDYLQLRRKTFGAQASIAFVGFGLDIPGDVLSHPVMESMLLAAMDLLCLTNDMHSYSVELSRGIAFHNIVSSIILEHGLSVPAAMRWLEDFGNSRVKVFLHGIEKLPSWGPEIDDRIRKYIDSVGYLVRGADAWSYESGRYWGNKGQEVQRTRVVTILPKNEQHGLVTREELEATIQYTPTSSCRNNGCI